VIDTIALKTSIIDLAVSGKLSSQFHVNDTVSDIIAALPEVSSKRRKLLEQTFDYGKLTDIPTHWTWICLGKIASYGDPPRKAYYDDVSEDTWILDLEDIKSGGKILTKTRVHEKKFTGDKTIFKEGQVLYSKLRPYLKKVLVADEDGVSTPELISFDTYGGILPQYIVYCLLSSFTDRAIDKRSYGIKMPRVDTGFMVNLPIPLPPVSEQHIIVDKVQAAFSQIDTIDALQAQYADNLTVLQSKLIDAAIQGKLTEQLPDDGTAEELYQQIQAEKQTLIKAGKIKKEKPLPEISVDEIPFEIPSNWKWVRLGSIGITFTGGTPSKTHTEYYGGDYPFFKPSDLDAGRHITKASEYLTEAGKEVSRQLQKGSILVCCIGSIGKAAIIDTDGTANQQINALTPLACNSDYLLYAISSGALQHQLDQGSRATTVSIINKSKFDNCILPLPSLTEQKRIVTKLDKVLEMIGQIPPHSAGRELGRSPMVLT
jgi:type I restriction enzyme S subunit